MGTSVNDQDLDETETRRWHIDRDIETETTTLSAALKTISLTVLVPLVLTAPRIPGTQKYTPDPRTKKSQNESQPRCTFRDTSRPCGVH